MSIDRRTSRHVYYICEQHLAEILRPGKDGYGALPKEESDLVPCDMAKCPLSAIFEYFPNLINIVGNVKERDMIPIEDAL